MKLLLGTKFSQLLWRESGTIFSICFGGKISREIVQANTVIFYLGSCFHSTRGQTTPTIDLNETKVSDLPNRDFQDSGHRNAHHCQEDNAQNSENFNNLKPQNAVA